MPSCTSRSSVFRFTSQSTPRDSFVPLTATTNRGKSGLEALREEALSILKIAVAFVVPVIDGDMLRIRENL